MMAIKMANMCARVTSTYMEFTLTFGLKLEFKNTFKSCFCFSCMYFEPALILRTSVFYYIIMLLLIDTEILCEKIQKYLPEGKIVK